MNNIKRLRYNYNWELISAEIRFKRAKNKCERCGLSNGVYIRRFKQGNYQILDSVLINEQIIIYKRTGWTKKAWLKKKGITQIILTVAHLNHNEKDDRAENLLAMCQRCHLMHDRDDNRKRNKFAQWTDKV